VKRHGSRKRPAEINYRRSDPGIRVERVIGKTDGPALPAKEPFYEYVNGKRFVFPEHNSELFLLCIVPGQSATTCGTGIPAVKGYPLTCQDTALDNIDEERGNAWLFHILRVSLDLVWMYQSVSLDS
jgi:hypothetical protein